MEYIEGQTLEQELRDRGPLGAEEIVECGIALCSALAAVHAAGLLHRDVKAQNVMRDTNGHLWLTDFGTGRDAAETARRELAGTPLYLAPDILEGTSASTASDIYGLGVLLYHMATGAYPVAGRSVRDLIDAHRRGARSTLRTARPELPAALAAAIDRATDRDAARRYGSTAAFADALRAAAPVADSRGWGRRGAAWLAAGALALLVAAAFVTATTVIGGSRLTRAWEAALPIAGSQPTMRKVVVPAMGLMRAGTPSFDGRIYSNTDINEDLLVFDLASGESRTITDKGKADEYAEFSAASPDGRQVVYSWLGANDTYDLRLTSVDGGPPRVLVPSGRAIQIVPVEWSRDGSRVLCLFRQDAGRFQVGIVSVPGGDIRIVRDLGTVRPQHVTLSSDNRFIAYDFPADASGAQRDIFIQPLDGTSPRAIVAHPAEDVSPIWAPDGRHLFFLSNRSGSYDGWTVEIAEGYPLSEPRVVARNLGEVAIAGFTTAGALYYWQRSGDMDVFVRDLAAGATGTPQRVPSRLVGANSGAAWSPDGRWLAYIARRGMDGPDSQGVIVIHPLSGGNDREVALPLRRVSPTSVQWSADAREILFGGVDAQGRAGAFVLDVDTGTTAPLLVAPEGRAEFRSVQWWIDGRSLAYVSARGIVVRERGSGLERILFDPTIQPDRLRIDNFQISADHRSMAIAAWLQGSDPPVQVLLVSTIGGTPYELMRTTSPHMLALQAWLPDGRELLITTRDVRAPGPHALWRISMNGTARDTGIRIPGFTHVNRIHLDPGGTRIAYTADQVGWELWVLEHFLPEAVR
jgi:Tol biopolymer transport system component